MVEERRLSSRRAALKRQRALGSKEKGAMKVLEKYCKKKYRQSIIFSGIGSQIALNDPHLLRHETLGSPVSDSNGHYHSEPFTTRNAVDRRSVQLPEPSTAFSCPVDTKHAVNHIAYDFGEHNLKEEMKYHKGVESWTGYIWRILNILYYYLGLKHFLLLVLMVSYALAGGYMFYSIEAPAELIREEERVNTTIARTRVFSHLTLERIYQHCDLSKKPRLQGDPFDDSMTKCDHEVANIFQNYDDEVRKYYGLDSAWKWDFWNAVFYSGTIFTTIGYGNISCRTFHGRLATCAYALFGVPLMLIVLNLMGRGLFLSVQAFWEFMRRLVRRNVRRLRKSLLIRRVPTLESVHSDELTGLKKAHDMEGDEKAQEEEDDSTDEQDLFTTFPMTLALLTVFLYISLCSWLFCYWEDWDYSTAFYFFFISLSTVGLGDEMPNHPKRACAFFLFFIVGLALVSMCISILQVKVENQYMAALQLIDQEHQMANREEETRDREDTPNIERPDSLPVDSESIRWREDSCRSEASYLMTSPSSESPTVPPPVLGVFMTRRVSQRPNSIIFNDLSGSQNSIRRMRPFSLARSQEDILRSPTSPKVAQRSADLESPSGPQGARSSSPLASPRQAASLAVITEDVDEEVLQVPVPKPIAKPAGPPLEVPEVRIETAEEVENSAKKEKEKARKSSSLSSLTVEDRRF